MLSLINCITKQKEGNFKSYADIGEWLAKNGIEGDYYARPLNSCNPMAMRRIQVKIVEKEECQNIYGDIIEEAGIDREILMNGSNY